MARRNARTTISTLAVVLVTATGATGWGACAQPADPSPSGPASGGGQDVAPSLDGQGGVAICFAHRPQDKPDTLMVIPSGTIFVAHSPANGRKQPAQAEGFVTTETVTLTEMQPCSMADASTVVSHTRHWLVNPVQPQPTITFQPVGDVSGNGLDSGFEDDESGFRAAVKAGIITAHVQAPLHDTVYLTESDADLPDAGVRGSDTHMPDRP